MRTTLRTLLCLFSINFLLTGCGSNQADDSGSKPTEETTDESTTINPFEFTEKLSESRLADYHAQVDGKLKPELLKNEGSFVLYVVPLDYGTLLLSNLDKYYSKKYTDLELRDTFKEGMAYMSGKSFFILNFRFVGSYDNLDSVRIDDKFYEYFFLENEDGDFVRANYQEVDSMTDSLDKLDRINKDVEVMISFNKTEVENMMEGHEKMYLTFDGLDLFADNSMEILYPISKYYADFPEILTMLKDMNLQ